MRFPIVSVAIAAVFGFGLGLASPAPAQAADRYMAACKKQYGPTVDSYKLGKNGTFTCHYYRKVRRPLTSAEASNICHRMAATHGYQIVGAQKYADGTWTCMRK